MCGWNEKLDFYKNAIQTMKSAFRILMHESMINFVVDILGDENSAGHQTVVRQQI